MTGRAHDGARLEVHFPRVQRTDDGLARHDALAERSTAVGTPIVRGEEAIAKVEDGDVARADDDLAAFPRRDAVGRRDAYPAMVAHTGTSSMIFSGANCVGCFGIRPSSHGSRARD